VRKRELGALGPRQTLGSNAAEHGAPKTSRSSARLAALHRDRSVRRARLHAQPDRGVNILRSGPRRSDPRAREQRLSFFACVAGNRSFCSSPSRPEHGVGAIASQQITIYPPAPCTTRIASRSRSSPSPRSGRFHFVPRSLRPSAVFGGAVAHDRAPPVLKRSSPAISEAQKATRLRGRSGHACARDLISFGPGRVLRRASRACTLADGAGIRPRRPRRD